MQDDHSEDISNPPSLLDEPDTTTSSETLPSNPEPEQHHHPRRLMFAGIMLAILIIAGLVLLTNTHSAHPTTNKAATQVTINTQSLDNGTLNRLVNQNASDQPARQQLIISPETIFKNNVTANQSLVIGSNLQVGSSAAFQGSATFNTNVAVRGSLGVGGQLSAGSLNVGSLNVSNVTASGSLNFGGHLTPNGSTPTARPGTASGNGSVDINGNDTAGTITITTGSAGLGAGELATVNFKTSFGTTPKVQLTPINAASASLRYYATRGATQFTVDTATAPSTNTGYVFDYLISQ